jgi:2-succinyl-5-enolpyruvyl-6-hydroxy-3-cyclohexene-1-carboxylate synthase
MEQPGICFAMSAFPSSCRRMSLPFPAAVIQAVLAAGVQEFVICAGARNSALIVVLAALGDKVRLWQHFDERAAGFFALGRIRATGRPVAVVTTSGTAAAELLPSVIEAHYQGLPLVALTADRPKHYRGSGAPQAIEQEVLFGCYPSLSLDVENEPVNARAWDHGAPLHLNVCLGEPDSRDLETLRSCASLLKCEPYLISPFSHGVPINANMASVSRLVLAGDTLSSDVTSTVELAHMLEALIWAEASSGIQNAVEIQDRLLRCGDASLRHLPAKHVIRIGGVPAARYWRDLESRVDVPVSWFARSFHPGLARRENVAILGSDPAFPGGPESVCASDYLARDAALYAKLGNLLTRFPRSEPSLFRRLSQIIPQGATVFTGNSLAVREWNLCAEYGRGHRVHVLRGANGIDGNLSAFLGVAADEPESWCITGDLTALYDLNAPWMLRQLPPGKRRFVVIQNAGGKIFSRLPSLRGLTERERALMENPHNISLRGWAEMWGMDHTAGGAEILERAGSLADHAVIELYPDAAETEQFWNAWAEAEAEVWGLTAPQAGTENES